VIEVSGAAGISTASLVVGLGAAPALLDFFPMVRINTARELSGNHEWMMLTINIGQSRYLCDRASRTP